MTSYRWTKHRVFDAMGTDRTGLSAISMWRVARAAAEETLAGAPLVPAWLKLFRGQLSTTDRYWLRWQGEFGESAELRRAYSGLYGRFFARANLEHHLGLSRFVSLGRNGVTFGSVDVCRISGGDIPDWIAWDDANSGYVLCEAKGSLTANDFLSLGQPSCIGAGKKQFERVQCFDGNARLHPAEWVAATRWSTDRRGGEPATVLWDPPTRSGPFLPEDAARHRAAISSLWLDRISRGLGARDGVELLSKERRGAAVVIRAFPGQIPEEEDWPETDPYSEETIIEDWLEVPTITRSISQLSERENALGAGRRTVEADNLTDLAIYPDRMKLDPPESETAPFEGEFVAAIVTRFGIRPIRSASELDSMKMDQEAALERREPAMVVGIPVSPTTKDGKTWIDGAGISSPNGLSLFDLRQVDFNAS